MNFPNSKQTKARPGVFLFRRYISLGGLAKEPPKMNLVSVKYHIGAPDTDIPQNTTDFRIQSNGTSTRNRKQVNYNKKREVTNKFKIPYNIPDIPSEHLTHGGYELLKTEEGKCHQATHRS